MTDYTYTRNKNIEINLTNINPGVPNPGSPNLIITTFEWKINNIIQLNNTDNITINTNNLNLNSNEVHGQIQQL